MQPPVDAHMSKSTLIFMGSPCSSGGQAVPSCLGRTVAVGLGVGAVGVAPFGHGPVVEASTGYVELSLALIGNPWGQAPSTGAAHRCSWPPPGSGADVSGTGAGAGAGSEARSSGGIGGHSGAAAGVGAVCRCQSAHPA
jgi:hypothetical protein